MKTYTPKADEIERRWWLVDARDETLGRLASEVAKLLRGKHKPMYTPHLDTGDHVVVVNAEQIHVTGRKAEQKTYFRHSGYMGGEQHISFERMLDTHPDRIVHLAVKGMMPKNNLGRDMLKKLRVYAGSEHPHQSQQPEPFEI